MWQSPQLASNMTIAKEKTSDFLVAGRLPVSGAVHRVRCSRVSVVSVGGPLFRSTIA